MYIIYTCLKYPEILYILICRLSVTLDPIKHLIMNLNKTNGGIGSFILVHIVACLRQVGFSKNWILILSRSVFDWCQ